MTPTSPVVSATPSVAPAPLTGTVESRLDALLIPPQDRIDPVPEMLPHNADVSPVPEPPPTDAPSDAPPDTSVDAEEPPADDSDLPDPAKIDPNRMIEVKPSRWQNSIYPGYKAWKATGDVLGFQPVPQDVKQWYEEAVDKQAMEAHFTSGNPEDIVTFLGRWQEFSPEGMQTMLRVMPDFVARMAQSGNPAPLAQMARDLVQRVAQTATAIGNGALYNQMAVPIIQSYEQALYGRARQALASPDPQTQEFGRSLLNAAQVMEFDRTGQFRTDPGQAPAQPAPRSDPEVARLRQQIDALTRQQAQTSQQAFEQNLDAMIGGELTAKADEALAPLKSQVSPEVYDAVRDRLLAEVRSQVPRVGGSRYQQYTITYERAVRSPSEQASAALKNLYVSMAMPVIQSLRTKYLKQAANPVAQSAQVHATLARGASQVAPATASPAPAPSLQVPAGLRGQDRVKAMLDQLVG